MRRPTTPHWSLYIARCIANPVFRQHRSRILQRVFASHSSFVCHAVSSRMVATLVMSGTCTSMLSLHFSLSDCFWKSTQRLHLGDLRIVKPVVCCTQVVPDHAKYVYRCHDRARSRWGPWCPRLSILWSQQSTNVYLQRSGSSGQPSWSSLYTVLF